MDEFLEKPTFTIGQVWFDFVKRLPRMSPRYRFNKLGSSSNWAETLAGLQQQQASPEQINVLQAQLGQMKYDPAMYQPYGWPYGYGGIGNLFGGLG